MQLHPEQKELVFSLVPVVRFFVQQLQRIVVVVVEGLFPGGVGLVGIENVHFPEQLPVPLEGLTLLLVQHLACGHRPGRDEAFFVERAKETKLTPPGEVFPFRFHALELDRIAVGKRHELDHGQTLEERKPLREHVDRKQAVCAHTRIGQFEVVEALDRERQHVDQVEARLVDHLVDVDNLIDQHLLDVLRGDVHEAVDVGVIEDFHRFDLQVSEAHDRRAVLFED